MNLQEAPEDVAFRADARAWLSRNAPKAPRPTEHAAGLAYDRAWQRSLYDGGWAGVNGPRPMAAAACRASST